VVGDIRDREKLARVFETYHPDIVFHTSAYKHVPLMEEHPEEAIKTNILGTINAAELSARYRVKKFINISTDKAVNPTSIMGATKRFSEMVCQNLNGESTKFTSVRFGNVLGRECDSFVFGADKVRRPGHCHSPPNRTLFYVYS
jgi:FlaA1/EpsC-like NDP-sugar epimerase